MPTLLKHCDGLRRLMIMLVINAITTVAIAASSEDLVLAKIYSTRTITAHLSLGYNMKSLRSMAKRLSPSDVPTLFKLYSNNKKDRLGIKLALASQCKASLDVLIRMINPQSSVNFEHYQMDKLDMLDVASDISKFEYCDMDIRNQAKQFNNDLRKIIDIENAKKQERYKLEREEERKRIYNNNLEQLKKLQ